jgi:sporulation protein YlmC with PRC-barrel domain
MQLELGTPVGCADGPCGELSCVVIDTATTHVTHLVVEPHHHHALARLVPLALAHADLSEQAASPPALLLRCTIEELHGLAPVEESAYVAALGDAYTDFPVDPHWDDPHVLVTYDTVPGGEIEISRTSAVTSADGHQLGHIDALVVDFDARVMELVIERGHGWAGRRVTIPMGAVARVETESVTLKLTKAAALA